MVPMLFSSISISDLFDLFPIHIYNEHNKPVMLAIDLYSTVYSAHFFNELRVINKPIQTIIIHRCSFGVALAYWFINNRIKESLFFKTLEG